MRKAEKITYVFLFPTLIILFIFTFYPMIYETIASFYKIDYIKNIVRFNGIQNYLNLFSDPLLFIAFKNTFVFVVLAVVAEIILGFLFAIFFYFAKLKYERFFRSLTLIPMLLPPITVSLTWKMMYDYNYGIINWFIKNLGGNPIEWLNSSKLALYSIILTDIWQWTPFAFLVLFAHLQALPQELFESAEIDGVNYMQKIMYIVLPLIKPALALVMLLRTIDTFRVFDKVYAMTGGGPGNATETITFYIYRNAFRYFQVGYASSAAIIMVIVVILFSLPYIRNMFMEMEG